MTATETGLIEATRTGRPRIGRPRTGRRFLMLPIIAAVAVVLAVQPAYAGFKHTRSMKTADFFDGATVVMNTTGMPLSEENDWHEMSMTLYSPRESANGATALVKGVRYPMAATWAIAIGRSNGYNSEPGTNIHDGQLHAYTLSTFAPADAGQNHQLMYWDGHNGAIRSVTGTETAGDIAANRDYELSVEWTGQSKDIAYTAGTPVRGVNANWADKKSHPAYLWVAKVNGVKFSYCWFNDYRARVKYECNHVRVGRLRSTNSFKSLRVRVKSVSPYYKAISPGAAFPLDSNHGYYTSSVTPYTRATFVLGAAKMVMTRTALAPLTGTPATVAGILRDGVDGSVVPSVPVTLLRSGNGGTTWTTVSSSLRTNAAGAVSMAVSSASPALYRFVSGSDAQHYPATSAVCSVRASDQLSLGAIPTGVSTKGTFTVAATLLPSQAGWVVLTADHWEGGAWKTKATAVMRRQADGRTYKAAVRLGTAGSWRLRAYHSQKGLLNVYSGYKVTTAK